MFDTIISAGGDALRANMHFLLAADELHTRRDDRILKVSHVSHEILALLQAWFCSKPPLLCLHAQSSAYMCVNGFKRP